MNDQRRTNSTGEFSTNLMGLTLGSSQDDQIRLNLLKLPLEIREMIYEYLFPDVIHPYPSASCRHLTGLGSAALARLNPDVAALLVNKQYYTEASEVMFRRSRFCIDFLGLLSRLSQSKSLPRIARMVLILESDDYIKLFDDEQTYKGASFARLPTASIFSKMNLRRLELCLVYPAPSRIERDDYCQRITVNLVLRTALPYVGWHPVKVYGYLKLDQKRSFEAKCAAMRKRCVPLIFPSGDFLLTNTPFRYLDWVNLKPLGCESGLPSEFLEWERDDGGVALVESSGRSYYDDEVEISGEEGCRCQETCSSFSWKVVCVDE